LREDKGRIEHLLATSQIVNWSASQLVYWSASLLSSWEEHTLSL